MRNIKKIMKFIKKNWLVFTIGLLALLFFLSSKFRSLFLSSTKTSLDTVSKPVLDSDALAPSNITNTKNSAKLIAVKVFEILKEGNLFYTFSLSSFRYEKSQPKFDSPNYSRLIELLKDYKPIFLDIQTQFIEMYKKDFLDIVVCTKTDDESSGFKVFSDTFDGVNFLQTNYSIVDKNQSLAQYLSKLRLQWYLDNSGVFVYGLEPRFN